jgi:hypothetical protein
MFADGECDVEDDDDNSGDDYGWMGLLIETGRLQRSFKIILMTSLEAYSMQLSN